MKACPACGHKHKDPSGAGPGVFPCLEIVGSAKAPGSTICGCRDPWHSLPAATPEKVYEKKGDGYTCQFCAQTFPAAQWNDRAQVCPNLKCAQPYNALLEQDGEE